MITIERAYDAGFVVDRSKMTRLISVINESFAQANAQCKIEYEVHLSSGRVLTMTMMDDVLDHDNSKRNRVERLSIRAESNMDQSAENSRYYCEVDFIGRKPAVVIEVDSVDAGWGYELMSLLEEQVERTLQQGVFHQIMSSSSKIELLFSLAFMGVLIIGLYLLFPSSRMADKMWLTETDILELQKAFDSSSSVTDPQTLIIDVYKRQVRNLSEKPALLKWIRDWRLLLIALPVLLVAFTLTYLLTTCYPPAVFLWGDCKEWYDAIVERRKTLWQVVVWSMIIGIISNLFVFGLGIYMK